MTAHSVWKWLKHHSLLTALYIKMNISYPKYAFMLSILAGKSCPLSSSLTPACRIFSTSPISSSPVITATLRSVFDSFAKAVRAFTHSCGLTPPALLTTRIPADQIDYITKNWIIV